MISRTYAAVVMILASSAIVGCSGTMGGFRGATEQPTQDGATAGLDGRSFDLRLSAERGGQSRDLKIAFNHGCVIASDGGDFGYIPSAYTAASSADGVDFEVEARSPSGVRRFKGRVVGTRIEGTLMLVPDGSATPTLFSFAGRSDS